MDMICRLHHLFTILICLAVVGFGSFAVLGCKDLKSFGEVIWTCNAVPGTTFAVRFPENNCTP